MSYYEFTVQISDLETAKKLHNDISLLENEDVFVSVLWKVNRKVVDA